MLFKATVVAAAMSALVQAQTQPQINTPTALFTCQPYAVTWSGGQPPYFVNVVPGGQPGAAPLESLGEQPTTATSYTWTVNIAAGTSVTLSITDSQGITQNSAPVTILAGASTSCIGQSPSGSASGSASSAASSAPASSVASSASSAVSSAASSVSTAVSAASSSVSSAASSAASSASSRAPSASGSAPPATSSQPASAGNKVVYSAAALVGAAAVVMIGA